MKLLLDTNVFIWLVSELPKVTAKALDACEDPANEILLGTASVWEMQIPQLREAGHEISPAPSS